MALGVSVAHSRSAGMDVLCGLLARWQKEWMVARDAPFLLTDARRVTPRMHFLQQRQNARVVSRPIINPRATCLGLVVTTAFALR